MLGREAAMSLIAYFAGSFTIGAHFRCDQWPTCAVCLGCVQRAWALETHGGLLAPEDDDAFNAVIHPTTNAMGPGLVQYSTVLACGGTEVRRGD